MRIALVYDYLNQLGGGERVLKVISEIFSDAPIYTILYDEQKTGGWFSNKNIKTSFLDFNLARTHHRWFIPLMPSAIQYIGLRHQCYDLIISVGAGYSQGIQCPAGTKHLYYCFTPLRYAWEEEYIPIQFRSLFFRPIQNYLKTWNYQTAQRPDKIITISNFIAQKIRNYYGRKADILYPPLDTNQFFFEGSGSGGDYFLAAGRLLRYKKFDLVIEAFNQLNLPLKITGAGPDLPRLKKLIKSDKIEMLGYVSDDKMRRLYNEARAFIFPQIEDFGLVGAEAQACGCPVIAFAAGGALEIVENKKTGIFFNQQTPEALIEAVNLFLQTEFDRNLISRSIDKFSLEQFTKRLKDSILL